ncbi:glycosyltransferase [Pleurocapsa sp. PCC 7327]|uniref:glycosyltransferase n=1 Tax=Pleurocapsa sp. PCC 7327 TaxID=118163 RepID=UPI00059BDBF0|nr:glycosyltransferase [Pleurocapsa sp. PCC 7327]
MTHFGILCPAAIGHLNPMCALGRELQRRGHRVTLFGIPDVQPKVMKAGLEFWIIGEAEFPTGTLEQNYKQLGEMSGLAGLKFTVGWFKQEMAMLFGEAPSAIKALGIEALLIDQVTLAGGTIADFLNLPFITICNALLVNREAGVPPYFTHWQYRDSWWANWRNHVGNFMINRLTKPLRDRAIAQRRQWELPPYASQGDFYSQLAQICQLPAEYDFPRVNLAPCFHYTGPLQEPSGLEPVSFPSISFPFEKLTGKPLIYASLGTLQNRNWEIFQSIAEACIGLDAQLVISLGNPNSQESGTSLPGSPIVVPYAPHQQLIERASLVITHAGMNTTIGALSSGVPLVAIPITNEQPGIAARIAWTGTGEVVPLKKLSAQSLQKAIKRVLTQESYKKNAFRLQEAIKRAGGLNRAADIIEQAVSTRKPVLAQIHQ